MYTALDDRPMLDIEPINPWVPSTLLVQRVMARKVTEWDANASRPKTPCDAFAGMALGRTETR